MPERTENDDTVIICRLLLLNHFQHPVEFRVILGKISGKLINLICQFKQGVFLVTVQLKIIFIKLSIFLDL